MNTDFIPPTFDYIVKGIFGSQDDIGNTIGLLTPILGIAPEEYAGMFIADPHLSRRWRKDKQSIVDVKLTLPSGKTIHIEVQIDDLKNMAKRALHQQAKRIADQIQSGENYQKLRPVISVLILDHIMFSEEPDYLNRYEFLNVKSHRPFTDIQKVITLELPKLPETDDGCPVWPWAKFFTCQSKEAMQMLAKSHPEVRSPVAKYKKLTLTQRMRDIAWEKQLLRMDKQAREDFVRDEATQTIARRLKARGVSIDQIAEDTGLSLEEVGRL
ncbi:hypothetical protein AGMMS50267_17260 [Spirochaetia bacterium]|nr:hypothetical protein AGMMS50267_17260 [Spirochaetia bacterium]